MPGPEVRSNTTRAYDLLRKAREKLADGELATQIDEFFERLDKRNEKRRRKRSRQKRVKIAQNVRDSKSAGEGAALDPEMQPNWSGKCDVCRQGPTVPLTGLCGPCTFGEASTVGGNW
jgi:hypothetical protein